MTNRQKKVACVRLILFIIWDSTALIHKRLETPRRDH